MLATLAHAMRHHDRGQVSDDPLVGTCWDADRLDLPRVGITPDPRLMSTASGQHAEVIATLADHRRDAPSWGDLAGCSRFSYDASEGARPPEFPTRRLRCRRRAIPTQSQRATRTHRDSRRQAASRSRHNHRRHS